VKRRSLWRRSSWRTISAIRRGALSRLPYCKECWCASSAATRSIGVPRRTSKQKLYYYRCIGSDAYRHLCGPVCTNRPICQDYLDQFVWQEIIGVLEKPELIQAEIQRRLEAAQKSDPVLKREQSLRRELARLDASTERLLTAYQENQLTLAELRRRMPELRKQQQAIQSELTSMELAASDQSRYLRLTHTLTEFRQRLHAKSETMEVLERQKILRLLVKEILVGTDTITVRHSLPIAGSEPPSSGPVDGPGSTGAPSGTPSGASYLLRSGSDGATTANPP
jgi:site-specific DNA recombinase